ncbi:hypothetical protein DYQ86_04995 [Acidobacteria bacterium AB60]|nr:hypothetical protein DYQ86_04995 [Acidobacteria bacterium AB60]
MAKTRIFSRPTFREEPQQHARGDGEDVKAPDAGGRPDGPAIDTTHTATFDGIHASGSGQGAPYDTISLKHVNASTFSYESKNSTNKYHVRGRLVVSAGGKTMTMNAKRTDAERKPISIPLVYDKQ